MFRNCLNVAVTSVIYHARGVLEVLYFMFVVGPSPGRAADTCAPGCRGTEERRRGAESGPSLQAQTSHYYNSFGTLRDKNVNLSPETSEGVTQRLLSDERTIFSSSKLYPYTDTNRYHQNSFRIHDTYRCCVWCTYFVYVTTWIHVPRLRYDQYRWY